MRKVITGLVLALIVALGSFVPAEAAAREVYHGFVKDAYYLGRGGTPASFEQVADNPLAIFRSEAAYMNLRAHVSTYLGRPLSDAEFRALLRSDDVRLIPCFGTINTAGVSDSGRFGWRVRNCYQGELLMQVRLDGDRWVTVASQGCFNPVEGVVPPLPPPPPPPPPVEEVRRPVCRMIAVRQEGSGPELTFLPGFILENCCPNCVPPTFIQGLLLQSGGSSHSVTYIQVCE